MERRLSEEASLNDRMIEDVDRALRTRYLHLWHYAKQDQTISSEISIISQTIF